MSASFKITLLGYYGYGNAGDELMLMAILDGLSDIDVDLLYFGKPDFTYPNMTYIERKNPLYVLRSIFTSKVLILGGGNILQDSSGSLSYYYYYFILRLAVLLGKKTIIFNNGIGPLKSRIKQYLTKGLIKRIDQVSYRDQRSYDNYVSNNLNSYLGADPVFLLDTKNIISAESTKTVLVALRTLRGFNSSIFFRQLKTELQEKGFVVKFLAFQKNHDDKICTKEEIISYTDPKELFSIISSSDFLIGMRYHSLVIAAMCNKPMLALNYDPKVEDFANYMEIPCFDLDNIDIKNIVTYVANFESSSQDYSEKVQEQKQRLESTWTKLRSIILIN